jgi:hypothetical protein
MGEAQIIFVRGRCACGQSYRIRNARPGVVVTCPACRRSITVTQADIRIALAGERLVPVQERDAGIKEAILIDAGDLRLAGDGSRPGLTGQTAPQHEEAALLSGMRQSPLAALTGGAVPGRPLEGATAGDERPARLRGFAADLIASFYFAGHVANALKVLSLAAGCSVVLLVSWLVPSIFGLLTLIVGALVGLYVVQFYWSVLGHTAKGEDVLPWFEADWDLWDDAFKPMLWLIVISGLCSLPAIAVYWHMPATHAWKNHALVAAAVVGWLFWPVAVMSVALGQTLLFVRPDWLVRCIVGIGPAYLLAWLLVMMVLVGSVALYHFGEVVVALPLIGLTVNLYLGYVLFRMLGLLFRHFRTRFPWKY